MNNDAEIMEKMRTLVEIGKRMRAVQQDYFRTRNLHTMREAMRLENQFDDLLVETEKVLDGR